MRHKVSKCFRVTPAGFTFLPPDLKETKMTVVQLPEDLSLKGFLSFFSVAGESSSSSTDFGEL